jgi:hypothetical protein
MVLLKAYIFKSENNLKTFCSYNMERNQDKDSEGGLAAGPDSRFQIPDSRFQIPDKLLFYKFIIL